ncbi:sorting nexin-4-like [Daktulosphaira vitifoliae]|uniref:sorting nexin-4-like n=1 Tax=Daktulosphaira vitifoliae TaxID=58002 RepID=UPI0021AAB78F|nr:sorting nexin-4-like [Daktulosphaira vitifoliae]
MANISKKDDTLANHAIIVITEAEKRMNSALSLKEYYTVYIIETKVDSAEWAVSKGIQKLSFATRRYTDFTILHSHLEQKYPWTIVPPLPEKKQSFMWNRDAVSDTMDPDFIDRRRAALESFLKRIASHIELGFDETFIRFLGEKENWVDDNATSYGIIKDTEHSIKNFNLSIRNKTSDGRFEAIKSYSNKLQGSINKVLSCRAKRAENLYNVDMLHSHYGKIFSELSAVDNDVGDAVQKTGHYMDSIASAITPALEDEEFIMDQLKEYLAFTNSLHTLTRNHDLMHYNLDNLNNMSNNKETSGIMSRLFGYTSSAAGRDAAAIEALENRRIEAKSDYVDFVDKSLENYKMFENQKDKDLMKILKDYVTFQTKYAQKGLQTWKNILQSIQSIE